MRLSPSRVVAAVMAGSLLAGCAVETSLDSPDSAACIRAIRIVAHGNDRRAIPKLIELLDRDDSAVRLLSIRTLEKLTGETMGYDPTAPTLQRDEAVERWREWYTTQGGKETASAGVEKRVEAAHQEEAR